MKCPFCKQDKLRVINSRATADGTSIKRRRQCENCKRRFTTYERIEGSLLRIVKKDGSRQDFNRQKILSGLLKACEKRPVSADALETLIDEVEQDVHKRFDREAPAYVVGELVMDKLRNLDPVAYIRFASVYREFKDVSDFVEEVQPILEESGGGKEESEA
ncbi:MAG TPA: transcriptional regulator NrdR [Candidatus Brocadiia bacterium]|nr:transcriptional regulator NrdR [Candidatus Brocadiia bacterium]